ncbi:ORF6N domain-containing protein [Citrobacter sp. Cpo113]|uniref:ORF6N domain-containing protein n=1 Tax=Citrobacter sp. Cpo113 TaxID=2985146 RepID=UPI00257828C6|nr:ORF6N domain-containing protein [Citrobacter sp. Cpo113]MDM2789461.1 ORF6N domain-containing protein [Citrobacter sp. Cpo113]
MTTQINAENLSPITHNQIPVVTTELLAQLYGTERQRITNNFNRNKERFVEGKHYFMAKGEALGNLKNSLRGFQAVAPNVRKLILWTERGAARHAKMLETDQAWEVFEKLEDCYFNQGNTKSNAPALDLMNFDIYQAVRNGKVAFVKHYREGELITADEALALLKARGWLVMTREELAGKLMQL